MTKDTDGYVVIQILPSSTHRVDERPRIPIGTWSYKFYEVLPSGWTDDQGCRRVPSLTNFRYVLPVGWTDNQGYLQSLTWQG